MYLCFWVTETSNNLLYTHKKGAYAPFLFKQSVKKSFYIFVGFVNRALPKTILWNENQINPNSPSGAFY